MKCSKSFLFNGLTLSGPDASNYDIAPASLTITGASAASRVYDATQTVAASLAVAGHDASSTDRGDIRFFIGTRFRY